MEQDLRKILLQSSNVENDDENHHELLRYSGRMKKNKEVEPTTKNNLKDLGERHLTDDISFLRQSSKDFGNGSGKIRRVR